MSSEMRELIAKWRAVAEKQRGMASRDNERGDLECAARMAGMAERTEYMADELEALLARTEAGADASVFEKCWLQIVDVLDEVRPEWHRDGDSAINNAVSTIRSLAATVADGAVPLWISCHWREDLGRDSVVSVVNRQDSAHTLQVYVSTHPHDASGDADEVICEHSGCGHGPQANQVPVTVWPGDKVLMRRGRLGAAMQAKEAK